MPEMPGLEACSCLSAATQQAAQQACCALLLGTVHMQ
jgi:hypothetical protein